MTRRNRTKIMPRNVGLTVCRSRKREAYKLPIVVSPYYFRLNDMWMLDLTSLDFTLWQEVRAWLSILYIAKLTLFILDSSISSKLFFL